MAKQVTHAVKFTDPIQPSIGPDRLLFVLACGDGSIYEFQKIEDSPLWNLRSRGDRAESPHNWTARRAPLPEDVEDTLDDEVGEKKWTQ